MSLSIFTWPNNSGNNYIDPNYQPGWTTRITALVNGSYKAWQGHNPNTGESNLITNWEIHSSLFNKAVETESSLDNLTIYDLWEQPILQTSIYPIQETFTSSENLTGAKVGVTFYSYTSRDKFREGDPVIIGSADGTLAEWNAQGPTYDSGTEILYTDPEEGIQGNEVYLFRDSSLTIPLRYVQSVTNEAVDHFPDPTSAFDLATFNFEFNSKSARRVAPTTTFTFTDPGGTYNPIDGTGLQKQLNGLGTLYAKNFNHQTDDNNSAYHLYTDSNRTNLLDLNEIYTDYTTVGEPEFIVTTSAFTNGNNWYIDATNSSRSYIASSTSATGFKRRDRNGAYSNDLNAVTFNERKTIPTTDGASNISIENSYIKTEYFFGLGSQQTSSYPGEGRYVEPIYATDGTTQVNTVNTLVVSTNSGSQPAIIDTNWTTGYWHNINGVVSGDQWTIFNDMNTTYNGRKVYAHPGGSFDASKYRVGATNAPSANQINTGVTEQNNAVEVSSVAVNGISYKVIDIYQRNPQDTLNNHPVWTTLKSYVTLGDTKGMWLDITENSGTNSTKVFVSPGPSIFTAVGSTNPDRVWQYIRCFAFPNIAFNPNSAIDDINTSWATNPTFDSTGNGSNGTWSGGNFTLKTNQENINTVDRYTSNSYWTFTTDSDGYIPKTDPNYNKLVNGTFIYTSNNATGFPTAISIIEEETTRKRIATHGDHAAGSTLNWLNNPYLLTAANVTYSSRGQNYFDVTGADYTYLQTGDTFKFAETDRIQWFSPNNTTNVAGVTVAGNLTASTGGSLTTTAAGEVTNHPNFTFLSGGNLTYKKRTGASTYVNGAEVDLTKVYQLDQSTHTNITTDCTWTVTQDSNGYVTGATLDAQGKRVSPWDFSTVGSNNNTVKWLIKTGADTYTPPALTPSEQADVFDTDDEWASDGYNANKEWPNHVSPQSANIVYNSPTIVNTSSSGIKYTRSMGHTKWQLEVTYPPMKMADFQKFHAIAQAAHGQSTPFFFSLKNKDNDEILWRDTYTAGTTKHIRLKNAMSLGDTTLLAEGFTSSQANAFTRGEVFIDGENENGNLHTALNTVTSNVYGEAKIRMPWPVRQPMSAGQKIYKHPSHAVVSLADDNFNYSVDQNNYYYVTVMFDLDRWK
tara:strand:- start:2985 stop:6389 length:3405 start_codon:yes stop_codon:yes gene_type:complete